MNNLLKRQAADYFSNNSEIEPAVMELLEVISSTYNFFESKINELDDVAVILPDSKETRRTAGGYGSSDADEMAPFGYAQLIPQPMLNRTAIKMPSR